MARLIYSQSEVLEPNKSGRSVAFQKAIYGVLV